MAVSYTARSASAKPVTSPPRSKEWSEMHFAKGAILLAVVFIAEQSVAAVQDNLQPSSPDAIQSYESGYSLLKSCNDPQQRAYCVGYVVGVLDAYNSLSGTRSDKSLRICLPNGLLKSQVGAAVTKYLAGNPDSLNADASSITFEALVKAFPCN
jgi:hypothetical protein